MFRIPIAVSIVGLSLTAVPFIAEAEGQESQTDSAAPTPSPRIVWQKELDSEIRLREHRNDSKALTHSEPDVGFSPDSTRANPVRMVSTFKSVYLFDGEGQIERRIPLKWDPIPDEVKTLTPLTVDDYIRRVGDKREFINELSTTDPKGRFYIIRTLVTRGYDGRGTRSIRAYNADGSLRFELKNRFEEEPPIYLSFQFYLSPNGEYMVMFYNGWGENPFAFFDLYETATGSRLRHVSHDDFHQYDFAPARLVFSETGSHVMLKGAEIDLTEKKKTRTLLIFDGRGNSIQPPEGPRAKSVTAAEAQHSMKQAIYRQLVDPQAPLDSQPKEMRDVKMLPDRKRGVYTSGKTLYLFELQPSP